MYINRKQLNEFPFDAYFYRVGIDESLPLDQQKEERVLILETPCDIQEASHSYASSFISAQYSVYLPLDINTEDVEIRNGDAFESEIYGMSINGKVVGVFPSQLGGITVYIQDSDV